MEKITNRVLIGPSGKKENLAGSSWKGISYIPTRLVYRPDENYFYRTLVSRKYEG